MDTQKNRQLFQPHTSETAPKGAAEVLGQAKERYGFVPNLAAFLAEAPVALEGVLVLSGGFEKTSLSPQEQQVVLLSASAANTCNYCRTVHTGLARQAGVDALTAAGIAQCRPLSDPKLEALRAFTSAVVEQRGQVDGEAVKRFLAAGYTKAQVFEVVMGVALKTFTNYSNHLAGAEPNPEFVAMAG